MRSLALGILLFSTIWAVAAPTPNVNCDNGQSLNATLVKMNKFSPATVVFTGTCNEYVVVDGFENLTLMGVQGATIQQPNTPPPTNPAYVLSVKESRSVTFSGFAVRSQPSVFSCIGIGGGSTDVMLRDITTDGAWESSCMRPARRGLSGQRSTWSTDMPRFQPLINLTFTS